MRARDRSFQAQPASRRRARAPRGHRDPLGRPRRPHKGVALDAGPVRALARVDLGAITRNCERLCSIAGDAGLCAVVKADGYGHGAVQSARAARAGGAGWLAVATAGEAAELRAAGDDGPVLVMGALSQRELAVAIAAGADIVAWRTGFVERLAAEAGADGIGVHVKYDTGMGRLGTRDADEATAVANAILDAPSLRLAGLMTHFATSDDDADFLRAQLDQFVPWALELRSEAGRDGVLLHAANSAAAIGEPDSRLDLVRCGIAIYGMDPFQRDPADHGLDPALALVSYVAEVKRVAAGQSAGYGRRFVAESDTWLATLPIGYGDGVRRGLTNNAEVLITGHRFPLRGTVSMDNVTAELGQADHEPPVRGEEAILIGAQGGQRILAEEVAQRLGTINYEVTCGISARVPRVYSREPLP